MTTRTYAAWVEPRAAELREGRSEIARTARKLLTEHWTLPSPLEGWTYKDLLAHLATGDWALQIGLRKVIANQPLRISEFADVDATNARNIEERKKRSVDELIAEVEAESEETQELLAQLSNEHEQLTPEDAPTTFGDYLRQFPGHDQAHLAQLRTALDNVML
jgi:uncharacterized protein (TIGR03083 family)